MGNPDPEPHVLIFPLPLQGPINCMLKFAELLCLHGIKVTFLNTHHIQQRLFRCTHSQAYFARYHRLFHFHSIPDGLPDDNPRTALQFSEMMESLQATAAPILHHLLTSTPLTAIIADAILGFAAPAAARIQLPLFFFETISPSALWTYLCLPKLIQFGEIPFKGLPLLFLLFPNVYLLISAV